MLIRHCKIFLVLIMAIFFTLVVFNNTFDYHTNYVFVQHVVTMDTIFPDSNTKWRALTNESLATLFYWGIISWEALSGIVCWLAAIKLFQYRNDAIQFAKNKSIAVLGLTLGLALYAFGFIVVGAEWFQMWQSAQWNGQVGASVFINMIGLILLVILAKDE